MSFLNERHELVKSAKKEDSRRKKHEQESRQILGQTVYLTTLGIVIVLPIVAGAYIGSWLDDTVQGFSFSWTICLIIIGVFVGAVNVWLLVGQSRRL